ncbi:MAG: hypothetical protein IKD53_08830, partial [Clostridia bacterium]|nr:hypothetical protein [Clostridia bacterium]
MKKVLSILLVAMLLALSTSACAESVSFRLAHTAAEGGHFDMIAKKFVETLGELSDGRLSGTVY